MAQVLSQVSVEGYAPSVRSELSCRGRLPDLGLIFNNFAGQLLS